MGKYRKTALTVVCAAGGIALAVFVLGPAGLVFLAEMAKFGGPVVAGLVAYTESNNAKTEAREAKAEARAAKDHARAAELK